MKNEMIKRESIIVVVSEYNEAIKKIRDAYSKLQEAENSLNTVFFDGHFQVMPNYHHAKNEVERVIFNIKIAAWRSMINRLQIREVMSIKDKNNLDKQLEEGKNLPEFTVENILAMIEGFSQDFDGLLRKSAAEIFDWLRPHSGWVDDYKTNKREYVGHKIIKDFMVDSWGVIYDREQYILALDNVFSLLDGKGPSKYPGNLLTAIKNTIRAKGKECETDYFRCKWYKKGTMHIEIKRDDLRTALNKMVGSNYVGKGE